MTIILKEMFFRTAAMLVISMQVCWGLDPPKSYGSSPSKDNYQNNYEPEIQRPLAVFTEKPVNVANLVLIPVVQVPSSDLKLVYKPQIDSVSKTEPVIMCKSSSKSFEATPAVLVPLQQPFYLYDERTLIPFPKTVTILHGGYRMSIPVGVVVAPIPVGVLRSGPVLVTTLYAIPASPVLVPSTIRFVPVNPSPPHYSNPSPAQYSHPAPPSSPSAYSNPSPPAYSNPSPPAYSNPSPPVYFHPSPAPSLPAYSHPPAPPSPPAYSHPSAPPAYSHPPAPPSPPAYSHSSPLMYSHPAPPPKYSLPAPPEPTYYQHGGGGDPAGGDLRNRDPPGQLYSHHAVSPPGQLYTHYAADPPFHNSKESPVLQQLRDEAEKNRQKYAPSPPTYSVQYQVIDTY